MGAGCQPMKAVGGSSVGSARVPDVVSSRDSGSSVGQRLSGEGGQSTNSDAQKPVTELESATAAPILADPRPQVATVLTDDAQLIAACRRGEARATQHKTMPLWIQRGLERDAAHE